MLIKPAHVNINTNHHSHTLIFDDHQSEFIKNPISYSTKNPHSLYCSSFNCILKHTRVKIENDFLCAVFI
jgi:hypothetical protein